MTKERFDNIILGLKRIVLEKECGICGAISTLWIRHYIYEEEYHIFKELIDFELSKIEESYTSHGTKDEFGAYKFQTLTKRLEFLEQLKLKENGE